MQPCEFSYSSRVILNNISFTCEDRDRLCIVGPNDAGKTTLLRIIRHELEPDAGTVSSPEWHNVGEDSAVTINDLLLLPPHTTVIFSMRLIP
ncbi:ATP-binding cassette domain-containing protein [Alloscardovia omnicolens]|uniref:ATP-binding cassette domain-containing protein n=1 Tax=Alloscardovia omnicolens TaxID=419015 RepID=UPI000A74640E|nr:ATP-binding cassette domain-containing protein [Alloscardovia omnicolens]